MVYQIEKKYPNIVINKSKRLLKAAFYADRKLYRADSLLQFLIAETPAGHVTFKFPTNDIRHTKGHKKTMV